MQIADYFSKVANAIARADEVYDMIKYPGTISRDQIHDSPPFGSPQFLFSFLALQPLLSVICGNSKTCTVIISFFLIPWPAVK